jgi:hypothetical protein
MGLNVYTFYYWHIQISVLKRVIEQNYFFLIFFPSNFFLVGRRTKFLLKCVQEQSMHICMYVPE